MIAPMRGTASSDHSPADYSLPRAAWNQFATEAAAALGEFEAAMAAPRAAQQQRLLAILRANAGTCFGRAHAFDAIDSIADFQRRVPQSGWLDMAPWVERSKAGEHAVLTAEDPVHFERTSGSGARSKDIPYTPALLCEFQSALVASLASLHRDCPDIAGPGYWSLSPQLAPPQKTPAGVTVGSASDALYVAGSPAAHLLASVVGADALSADASAWQLRTWQRLVLEPDLRLMSVWSPGFLLALLQLLLDPAHGEEQLETLRTGLPTDRHRLLATAVRQRDFTALWPRLQLIHCWTDGPSAVHAEQLARLFPAVRLVPKGLFATEGVVSISWGCTGARPVAVTSHFLEFVDDAGEVRLVSELETGRHYRPLLTTSGGLYRYRLGDVVEVTGFLVATPCLRFVGREDHRSDLVGEKLDEQIAARALRDAAISGPAMLVPDSAARPPRYLLVVEAPDAARAAAVENELARVHHYAIARAQGQLAVLAVRTIGNLSALHHAAWQAAGRRSGDAKPAALIASPEFAAQIVQLLRVTSAEAAA
jgi:hypothetical protein